MMAVTRLLVYCVVVLLVLGAFALRSAYGDMKESALVIGRQLSQFGDLTGSAHRLLLNGEAINVASAITDQTVQQVLDRFQAACEAGDIGLTDEFKQLPQALTKKAFEQAGQESGTRIGIMRREDDAEGMIACLVREHQMSSLPVTERLAAFAKSGDLGDLGGLRYAYARRTRAGRTHVITSWTDGSFRVFNLAPVDGSEPPGSDLPHVGRPTGSKRLLSARIDGTPHSVQIYDAPSKANGVLSSFDRDLPAKGWTVTPLVARQAPGSRAYSRKGVDMLIFATQDGDRSLVSIVETRSE